jgi:hypothetical protein
MNSSVSGRVQTLLSQDISEINSHLLSGDIRQGSQEKSQAYGGSCLVSAGCASTFGELGYAYKVMKDSPVVGFGIGYSFSNLKRSMALNGITEILLRWGLAGLIILLYLLMYGGANKKRLFIILFVYSLSFGNLGQPLFWLLISLIYTAHRRENKAILDN